MTEACSLNQALAKVRLLPPHRKWEMGGLSTWWLYFKETAFRSLLRKVFMVLTLTKKILFSLLNDLHTSQRVRKKITYRLPKGNALRKEKERQVSFPIYTKGNPFSFLFFYMCIYPHSYNIIWFKMQRFVTFVRYSLILERTITQIFLL